MTETIGECASPGITPEVFLELDAHLDSIRRTSDALKGVGAMLYPETADGDFQMNMTRVSEVSAVFAFFGEVLEAHRCAAVEAMHRIQCAARRGAA